MKRSRNRGRSRSRSSGSGRSKSAILAFIALLMMGGVLGVFFWLQSSSRAEATDRETLCPLVTGPVAMTAILLDLTDPLSQTQHTQLMAWLDKEVADAPRGTQFTMGLVSDNPQLWGATVPRCKPQDGSTASAMTQNAKLIERRYQEQFLSPLQEAISRMSTSSGAKSSPIMESLQALAADSAGFLTFAGPRRVIIVSDLLQNSDALSFYRGGSWSTFGKSSASKMLSSTLAGAEILIFQVPRSADAVKDLEAVDDFWLRYFDLQGAHKPTIKHLGDL
jgi:hypothetical protein